MSTVLAVDGNSLAHRAWHALIDEPLDGAWVTHGVVRMLATAWRHGPFDAIVIALDSRRSLRRERDPEYKANRDDHDPRLHEQLERMATILAACGFTVLTRDGYEADDLLAATAGACREAGVSCVVLSSDRDLLALVGDDVTVLRPRQTMADLGVYDAAAVLDEFGVEPNQYLELAALRGDPSDNLPGVNGIGTKTAARLLRSWGSVAAIYEGLRDLRPAVARALRDGRGAVDRNLDLMRPMTDHPVDVAAVLDRAVDLDRVTRELGAVGLRAAATSFRGAVETGPLPPIPPPPEVEPWAPPPPRRDHASVHVQGVQAALFD